MSAVHETDQER